MKKIISFMHISLDGFVCGPQGEMDWIILDQDVFDHVEQRIQLSNTALYGRVTYQLMESYWPTAADKPNATSHDINHSKWYKNSHKAVLSKTLKQDGLSNTTILNDNLSEKLSELKRSTDGGNDILLFGSPRATHALHQLNLIDGYWLFVNPMVLGKGIPLFVNAPEKTKLQLVSTKQFACGVTELNYIRS